MTTFPEYALVRNALMDLTGQLGAQRRARASDKVGAPPDSAATLLLARTGSGRYRAMRAR
jgi:hypothetical protein